MKCIGIGTLFYSAIFSKRKNFHDFFFSFLVTPPKWSQVFKKRICSRRTFIKLTPMKNSGRNKNIRVVSLENVSISPIAVNSVNSEWNLI